MTIKQGEFVRNDCYLVQSDNTIQVFAFGCERQMLDLVTRLPAELLSSADKAKAGKILDGDRSLFDAGPRLIPCTTLCGVRIYLAKMFRSNQNKE